MKIIIRITLVLFLTNLFSCSHNSENKIFSAEPEIILKDFRSWWHANNAPGKNLLTTQHKQMLKDS